ncbi:hypothetical protein BJ508DRAFT_336424 [Ascobolus immersus RN42]|uniref:Uncharacterized protein n=1 Tax=Ascobolus immersus RN42 TaxID=1160509 RepID=A0A3N4HB87_ASCIM|nr:hypothetical protein BJ508DRAFT_336424 [Ascobolus immersus RN42]
MDEEVENHLDNLNIAQEEDVVEVVNRNLASAEQQTGGKWPAGEQPMWIIRLLLGIPGSSRKKAGDYSSNPHYYYHIARKSWERIPGHLQDIRTEDDQWKFFRAILINILQNFTPADHYIKIMNMKDNDLDDFFRIVRQAPAGEFNPVKCDWIKRRLHDKFHKAHGEMISIIYSVLKDILRILKNSKTGLQNVGVNNSGLSQKRKVACYVLDVNHPAINAELAAGLGNGAPYDPVIHWDWPINKVTAPAQL